MFACLHTMMSSVHAFTHLVISAELCQDVAQQLTTVYYVHCTAIAPCTTSSRTANSFLLHNTHTGNITATEEKHDSYYTASVAEWLRAWDTLTMFRSLKLRCAGGREFNPRPGQYSRMSFHPTGWLVRFSHLNMPFLPNSEFILNIVLVGKR